MQPSAILFHIGIIFGIFCPIKKKMGVALHTVDSTACHVIRIHVL